MGTTKVTPNSERYDDNMTNSTMKYTHRTFPVSALTNNNANYAPRNNERKIKLNKLNCEWLANIFNMICNCRSAFCFWWISILVSLLLFALALALTLYQMQPIFYKDIWNAEREKLPVFPQFSIIFPVGIWWKSCLTLMRNSKFSLKLGSYKMLC